MLRRVFIVVVFGFLLANTAFAAAAKTVDTSDPIPIGLETTTAIPLGEDAGILVTYAAPDADTPSLHFTGGGNLKITGREGSGVFSEHTGYSTLDFTGLASVSFSGNSAYNIRLLEGGAIHSSSQNSSSVILGDDASFESNIAGQRGGAIYSDSVNGSSTVTLGDEAIFKYNDAYLEGGAIYASSNDGAATVTIGDGSLFQGNTSLSSTAGAGGAIYVYSDTDAAEITIGNDSRFLDNEAGHDGGAIYARSSAGAATITIGDNSLFQNNKAAGSTNTVLGGAIFGQIINIGSGSQFLNNTAGTGGAIATREGKPAEITIGGNSLFRGNSASFRGGAIYLYGTSSQLALDTADGDIAFTGNFDGTGSNSVYLAADDAALNITGNGNVYFDDPVSAWSDGYTLTKNGTGFVQFKGENFLNQSVGSGHVTIAGGSFRLADNAVFNANVANFNVAAGAGLAGNGRIVATGGNFNISGSLSPDAFNYQIPDDLASATLSPAPDSSAIGVLNLDGTVSLNNATLDIDVAKQGGSQSSDRITVNGNVAYGGSGQILNLTNFVSGITDQVIMTATGGGLSAGQYDDDSHIAIGGIALGGRMAGTVHVTDADSGKELRVTIDEITNKKLTWNGTGDTWDFDNTRWNETDTSNAIPFAANDYVTFDGVGIAENAVELDLDGGAASVSGMEVSVGGSYTFTNGSIIGRKDSANKLSLTAEENGRLLVSHGSRAVFDNTSVDFDGGLSISDSSTVTLTGGGKFADSMAVAMDAGSSLNFDLAEADYAGGSLYNGSISGSGEFMKSGDGLLTLSGDSGAFNGSVIVDGGILDVRGDLGAADSTTVAGGAGLMLGTGGTLGDLVMEDMSEFHLDFSGNALNVANLTLGNSILKDATLKSGDWQAGQNYAMLHYTGTASGDLAQLTEPPIGNTGSNTVIGELFWNAREQTLYFGVKNILALNTYALTPNQRAAAEGIDSTDHNGPLFGYFDQLDTSWLPEGFYQTAGVGHATVKNFLADSSQSLGAAVIEETRRVRGNNFWFASNGKRQSMNGEAGNTGDAEMSGAEAALGYDWQGMHNSGGLHLGGAFQYARQKYEEDDGRHEADIDRLSLAAYAARTFSWGDGELRLLGGAAFSHYALNSARRIELPGLNESNHAEYNARAWNIFTEAAYGRRLSERFRLEPFLGLSYVSLTTEDFQERGGAAALSGSGGDVDAFSAALGSRVGLNINDRLSLDAKLAWRHSFGDRSPDSRFRFAGGRDFLIEGAPRARNSALVGLGLTAAVTDRVSLSLDYDGAFGNASSHSATASIAIGW